MGNDGGLTHNVCKSLGNHWLHECWCTLDAHSSMQQHALSASVLESCIVGKKPSPVFGLTCPIVDSGHIAAGYCIRHVLFTRMT